MPKRRRRQWSRHRSRHIGTARNRAYHASRARIEETCARPKLTVNGASLLRRKFRSNILCQGLAGRTRRSFQGCCMRWRREPGGHRAPTRARPSRACRISAGSDLKGTDSPRGASVILIEHFGSVARKEQRVQGIGSLGQKPRIQLQIRHRCTHSAHINS